MVVALCSSLQATKGTQSPFTVETACQPGPPLQGAGAVTAIAFSPDAAHLAVAATGSLLLYDVQTCSLSEWSRQHGAAMAARLKGPEQVHTISFQPSEKVCRRVWCRGSTTQLAMMPACA